MHLLAGSLDEAEQLGRLDDVDHGAEFLAEALRQQHEQLNVLLQKTIVEQQAMLVSSFEQNMARVIEHYLLGALGDQYDLKAQLPSIIKQMEANKQAIADDMKL